MKKEFVEELNNLINKLSMENGSDTPDYILTEFLVDCLQAFEKAVEKRDAWHGFVSWPDLTRRKEIKNEKNINL